MRESLTIIYTKFSYGPQNFLPCKTNHLSDEKIFLQNHNYNRTMTGPNQIKLKTYNRLKVFCLNIKHTLLGYHRMIQRLVQNKNYKVNLKARYKWEHLIHICAAIWTTCCYNRLLPGFPTCWVWKKYIHIINKMKNKWFFSIKIRANWWIHSLRPSDTIQHHGIWSTLAQVMACCLTAPSHNLNQCWLICPLGLERTFQCHFIWKKQFLIQIH